MSKTTIAIEEHINRINACITGVQQAMGEEKEDTAIEFVITAIRQLQLAEQRATRLSDTLTKRGIISLLKDLDQDIRRAMSEQHS